MAPIKYTLANTGTGWQVLDGADVVIAGATRAHALDMAEMLVAAVRAAGGSAMLSLGDGEGR